MEIAPRKGLKGLIENWQSDLIAAISVSLVAMPLGLGIALASGIPPISGIFSAIIGGIVATFFRGSHLTINGPTAGLIAVILSSIEAMDDGSGRALNYVFAAFVVSGVIQTLLGLLRLGRFADLFHSTVIHGILAAIGVIIFAKQIHIALGTTATTHDIIDTILDAFRQLPNVNPFVAIISLAGLLLLIFHSKISYKFFHFLPAPMWVLFLSIPFVYAFDFFEPHTLHFFGKNYPVGPELLINIPDKIWEAIAYPDFSKAHTLPFWVSVFSITLIASIESLACGKAIDKVDPYKRKSDMNKDLVGIGLSTIASGAIGGLPVINVIVRSTVNVHNHAKTKWSNLYHGILLLLFILLLAPIIQKVPLCTLAILLVYTGFKLASPKVFKHVYSQGIEQLIIFTGTLIITLYTNLLVGIFGGLALALLTHILLAHIPVESFFKMAFDPGSSLEQSDDGAYTLKIKGIANFLSSIKVNEMISQIPVGARVKVDLSETRLVDFSILEDLYEFQRAHVGKGGTVAMIGLAKHISSSSNKLAVKILTEPLHKLTTRERKLKELAIEHGWHFESEPSDPILYFESFYFFKTRPVEEILSKVDEPESSWKVCDITFEEGAYLAHEEYNTTVGLVEFKAPIPKFTIEKKTFPDMILNLADHKDIDYVLYREFSNEFIVKVENREEMTNFLNDELKTLIEDSEIIHHLESNGEAVMLFTDNLKLARVRDYDKIVQFAKTLYQLTHKVAR